MLVAGQGTVASQIREADWNHHPLGPVERWPIALRTALTTCLAARSPMQLWWGPQAFVFYNDAFIPWLGQVHPDALGRPAREVFAARWDSLGSGLQRVMIDRTIVETAGLSMLPLIGTTGNVDGVLCTFATDHVGDALFASLDHQAHDPLNALSVISTALSHRLTGELDTLAQPIRQLSRAIDNLLDVARLSRGKLVLQRSACELATIVDRALDLVMPLAEQRATKLFVSTPRTGMHVAADGERLARAIAHFLERAIHDAAPQTHVTVEVTRSRAGCTVSMKYEPAGTEVDHDRDRALLANQLVEMHGGAVIEERAGTMHEIEIDLPPAGASTVAIAPPTTDVPRNRVLLVEDDDGNAHILKIVLEQLGYVVALAHDAAVALQVASTFEPDLVVVDIGLPVLDGWEVARRLREHLGDVPVIAATARNQPADVQHSVEAGFFDHLAKPFDVEDLRRCLERLRSGQPSRLLRPAMAPVSPRKPI